MTAHSAGTSQRRALVVAAVVLGVGLGGFFDGIVLHQILQWHHMLSAIYPPDTPANIELNTTADGLFHAATWIVTVFGTLQLARAHRDGTPDQRTRVLVAGMIGGWGVFNVVEGVVDHFVLGLHHVRPGLDQGAWDLGFLALGALMVLAASSALRRIDLREDHAGAP